MSIHTFKVILDSEGVNALLKEKTFQYADVELNNARKVHDIMEEIFQVSQLAEEHIYMICLTTCGSIIGVFEVSHGTVNSCHITPREIMIRALLIGACSFILIHNHPSGKLTPSVEDKAFTARVKEASELIGIQLLDHIIIGKNQYYSFADNAIL